MSRVATTWRCPCRWTVHERWIGLSPEDDLDLFERYLARDVTTTLEAIVCVTPRLDHPCPGWIEHHGEGLGVFFELQAEVGLPLRSDRMLLHVDSLEDPTKPIAFCVEHPGAVARLQDQPSHNPHSARTT
jgi:hypothetical protein